MTDLNRRAALRTLSGVLATAGGWPASLTALGSQDDLTPWLAEHLGQLDWSVLEPAATQFRAGAATASLSGAVLAGRRPAEPIDQLLARKIRDDFGAGRIVDLAGWRLALTEARLLALVTG